MFHVIPIEIVTTTAKREGILLIYKVVHIDIRKSFKLEVCAMQIDAGTQPFFIQIHIRPIFHLVLQAS